LFVRDVGTRSRQKRSCIFPLEETGKTKGFYNSYLLPLRYLGVLGPKSRTKSLLQKLLDEGVSIAEENLNHVYSPIGLDIGADTPEKSALSIVAEIKAVLADRSGGSLLTESSTLRSSGSTVVNFPSGQVNVSSSCKVTGSFSTTVDVTILLTDGQTDINKSVVMGVYRRSDGDLGLVNLLKRSIAPRPSGCATGHPSPPRTLGLAASGSFCRDRPALTCATSPRLARKLAQ
jgi:hypothetical protein